MVREHSDGLPEGVAELTAELSAVVTRVSGEVEDKGVICRMIVSNAFLQVLMNSMGATAADLTRLQNYKYHEWGSDTTSEAGTQNKCITHVTNVTETGAGSLVSGTQVAGATSYTSVATLEAAGSISIAEHCVHPTGTVPTDSYGLDRSKFTAISLGSGDSITFTYVLNASGS